MKKFYLLLMSLLISGLAYGQASDLYFSKYGEGSSNNKFLEIYNGTGADVDLSQYSVELYTNGDTTVTHSLTLTGTLASGSVFVIANASADQTILDAADTTSTVTWFNGDDAIVLNKNGSPLDVIGVVGERPSTGGWDVAGVAHATKDHTLIRKSTVCDPTTDWAASAGTDANNSQWNVLGRDAGWNDLGSYSGCTTQPEIIITSPADNYEFNPETDQVTVEFTVNNFQVAQSGGDGYIYFYVDGGSFNEKFDTNPLTIAGLTAGSSHTVIMELVDNNGQSLNPPAADTVHFSIASYTQVADLAALRAGTLGNYYEVTGEVIITAGQLYNNSYFKGFVQDASAGIMIYDPNSILDLPAYNIYDGVTGVKGRLTSYRGMMELVPTVDPGGPSSNNNQITPQDVTIANFNAHHEDYESELIIFHRVFVDTSGGSVFHINTNYHLYKANDTTTLRVIFSDLDGETVPYGNEQNVTAIGAEYAGHPQVFPRNINDFVVKVATQQPIRGLRVYPNPVTGGWVYIQTPSGMAKKIQIYDITGQAVLRTDMPANGTLHLRLQPGIYMMQVEEDDHVSVVKLLIK